MYHQQVSKQTSASVRSAPISKDIISIVSNPNYGSLSSVVQKVQQDPDSVSDDEKQQLESAIGARSTKGILAGQQGSWVPEFQGFSAQVWGDAGQVGVPIQAKRKDEISVSEVRSENKTGLPDDLKAGVENLSGYSLDNVKVHYNSSKPSQLQAFAYTQGTEIHVAPGQEKHLPHEAWHVVQQMQGRVKPTMQMKGMGVNSDEGLEREADVMGVRALTGKVESSDAILRSASLVHGTIQRYTVLGPNKIFGVEPQKRPWFGYPYAVATGGSLVAQTHNPNATGSEDFLDAPNSNTAWTQTASNGFSLRLSSDNQMAVEDSDLTNRQPKVFFATERVINASNNTLQGKSAFSLQGNAGKTIKILTGWRADVTLQEVTPLYKGGSPDNAPQNCNEIAGQVVGRVNLATAAGDKAEKISGKYAKSQILELRELEVGVFDNVNQVNNRKNFLKNEIARRYVNRWTDWSIRREKANQYADPEVGEAYVIHTVGPDRIVNGQNQVFDHATGQNFNLNWAYHFGGVVARSGSDTITLENYARGDNRQAQPDPRWYFQMYGRKQQSYHAQHVPTNNYANPVTFVVK